MTFKTRKYCENKVQIIFKSFKVDLFEQAENAVIGLKLVKFWWNQISCLFDTQASTYINGLHIVHIAFWSAPRIYCWASWFKGDGLDFFQKFCITLTHHFSTIIFPQITNCCSIRHVKFVLVFVLAWIFGATLKHVWSKPFKIT